MAGDDDDRFGSDLRESPPPRSRSYHRSPDLEGREEYPTEARDVRENGDRYREVSWKCFTADYTGHMFN